MAGLPYDLQNRDIAIRTIIGEDPSMEGSAGVAAVLLNRLASGKYGSSIDDVVTASNQFEAWARQRDDLLSISTDDPRYIRIGQTLDAIATGAMPDPTNGATHFFGRASQAALGRSPPAWGVQPGQMLGGSEFYAPEGRVSYQAKSGVTRQPYHPKDAGLSDADIPAEMKGWKFARQLPDAATAPKPAVAAAAPDQSQLPAEMKGWKFAKELPPEHVGPPSVGEQIALHDRAAVTKPTPQPSVTGQRIEEAAQGIEAATPGMLSTAKDVLGENISGVWQAGREQVRRGVEGMKSGTLGGMAKGALEDIEGTITEAGALPAGLVFGGMELGGMGDPMMAGAEGAGVVGRLTEETPKEVPKETGVLPALPPGVPSGKIPVAALSSSERFPAPPKPAEIPMHLEAYKPSLREAREPEGSEPATESIDAVKQGEINRGETRIGTMPNGEVVIRRRDGSVIRRAGSGEGGAIIDIPLSYFDEKEMIPSSRAVIPAHLDEFKPSKRAAKETGNAAYRQHLKEIEKIDEWRKKAARGEVAGFSDPYAINSEYTRKMDEANRVYNEKKGAAKEAEAEPQAVGAAVSPKGPPLPPEPTKEWIRDLEADLNRYRGRRAADRPDLMQTYINTLPERYKPPEVQAKWDAYGQGDPKAILTDDERQGFEKYFAQEKGPKEIQESNYIEAMDLKKKFGAGVEEEEINPHYMRRNVKGKTPQFDPKEEGQVNPIGGRRSLPQSTSSMKERKFFALQDDYGNRKVVVHMSDGEWMVVEPGHSYSIDMDKKAKFNQVWVDGGGTKWRLTNAFTREITEVGGPEYYENAMANAIDNIARQRAVLDGLYEYKKLVESPEWKQWAQSRFDKEPRRPGYRMPNMPLFQNWFVDPRLADALDNFHGYEPMLGKYGAGVNRLAMGTMFLLPTAHWLNVLEHWAEGRGFDNITPKGMYSLVVDGFKGTKSVLAMDKTYQEVLKEGGGLLYSGVIHADYYANLMKSLGEDFKRNPGYWTKIADHLGLGLPVLVRAWYSGVQKLLWLGSDAMVMQRVLELKRKGMTTREAVEEAHRTIPRYLVPSRIGERMLGPELSQKASRVMQDQSVMGFGRYHYDVVRAWSNKIKDLVGPPQKDPLGESRRVHAIGGLLVLAVGMTYVNPELQWLWRKATGSKDDVYAPRGPKALIYPLIDMAMQTGWMKKHAPQTMLDYYDGRSDLMQALANLMILPGVTRAGFEASPIANRDLFTGKPVAEPADIHHLRIPRVIGEEAEHFAQSTVQPYQFAERAAKMSKAKDVLAEVEDVLKQFGKSALNITTPNVEGIKNVHAIQEKEALKNAGRNKDPLFRAGNWLQQWIDHNVLGQ